MELMRFDMILACKEKLFQKDENQKCSIGSTIFKKLVMLLGRR